MKKRNSIVLGLAFLGALVSFVPSEAAYRIPPAPADHAPHDILDRTILDKGVKAYRQGDYEKALSYFYMADSMGHKKAGRYIGLCYENGQGLPKDYRKAREWYEKSANNDDITSMYRLGQMYEKGEGVPVDDAKAAAWYKKSSYRTDIIGAPALAALARLYAEGKGVPESRENAVELYELADTAGYAPAHAALTALLGKEPDVHTPRVVTDQVSEGSSRDLADGVTDIDVSHIWNPVESIDFSSHHNVLIRNSDGTTVPMDEAWYEVKQIAPNTWQIRSDGDYCYLLAGDTMAVMIDCGYGAGNIRKEAEKIAGKPVKYVINTHYHFDHTANDAYFDPAFMSPISVPYATLPYASFTGIDFPRDYPVITVKDGYKLNLGNRELTILAFPHPNHAQGGIAILDPTSRILFTGDEFLFPNKIVLNITLPEFAENMKHLGTVRSLFNTMYGGPGEKDGSVFDAYYEAAMRGIMPDLSYEPSTSSNGPKPAASTGSGTIIYDRGRVRPGDSATVSPEKTLPGERETYTWNGFTVDFAKSR